MYAIDSGKVVLSRPDVGGYGGLDSKGNPLPGGAFVVQQVTRSGRTFYMLYGHIKTDTLPAVGASVVAGTIIARVGHYWYSDGSDVSHVHSGCMPDVLPSNPWAGYTSDKHGNQLGFVNPWHDATIDGHFYQGFLDSNQPAGGSVDPANPYVDGGYGGTQIGTATNPFKTVAQAISAASATQATIHIKPGTYREKIGTSKHIHFVTNGASTVRIGG